MPEGKIIPAAPGEYPELSGLPEGSTVKFEGEATLVKGGLQINSIELEPADNEATREVNRMTGNESAPAGSSSGSSSSGF